MAYTKTVWSDRVVSRPLTYTFQNNGDGSTTLVPSEGTITSTGTPLTANSLNNLETQYDKAMADVSTLYLPLTGAKILTGDLTLSVGADVTPFTLINDNGRIIFQNDATDNSIQSLTGDGTASRDFTIEGLNGASLITLNLKATTTLASGVLQSSNSLRTDNATTGATILVLKNSTDDAYLRVYTTATNTYIASSNYGSTASRNLLITGYSGNAMATFTVVANASQFNGTIQGTTINATSGLQVNGVDISTKYASINGASFNGNISAPVINATTNLQELGVNLSSKYAQISSPTFTGNVTANVFNATTELREIGIALSSKYLKLDGTNNLTGTLSGVNISITGQFDFTGTQKTYTSATPSYVLNVNNSDIIGVNGIHWNDSCNAFGEGLMFIKSTATAGSTVKADYDQFRVVDGIIYLDNTGALATIGLGLNNNGMFTVMGLASNYTTTNAGNVYSSASGILYRSTSSIRYKEDVQDVEVMQYENILNLRPVTFKSKSEHDDPNKRHLGLIAEEVETIDKMLVTYNDENEIEGVQYERLGVLLIPVVKDLLQRIEKLEGMVK